MTVDDSQVTPPEEDDARSGDIESRPGNVETPPATGDEAVDAALERLHERAESGTLDEQAEAAETTHRALQDRLSDLGGD